MSEEKKREIANLMAEIQKDVVKYRASDTALDVAASEIGRRLFCEDGFREALLARVARLQLDNQQDTATYMHALYTRCVSEFDVGCKCAGSADSRVSIAKTPTYEVRPEGRFVSPKVFLVGYSTGNIAGLRRYLHYTGQEDFMKALEIADSEGVQSAEALISVFAKMCYKALVIGPNANVTQVRDIKGNIRGCLASAHGSVFEHVVLNFIITDCSRVLTHELVRHRIGVAYSQTSGRYCSISPGELRLIWDPILDGCEEEVLTVMAAVERGVYLMECKKGLRKPPYDLDPDVLPYDNQFAPSVLAEIVTKEGDYRAETDQELDDILSKCIKAGNNLRKALSVQDCLRLQELCCWVRTTKEDGADFDFKKKLTSAIRRIAPNGQSNEIAFSANVRALRHIIMMRTSRFAEREIRIAFSQIYNICKGKWPLLFQDAQEKEIDGVMEVSGMCMQPYEQGLEDYTDEELIQEMEVRQS